MTGEVVADAIKAREHAADEHKTEPVVQVLYSCGRLVRVQFDRYGRVIDAVSFGCWAPNDRTGWLTLPSHPLETDPEWQPDDCGACGKPVLIPHRMCETLAGKAVA